MSVFSKRKMVAFALCLFAAGGFFLSCTSSKKEAVASNALYSSEPFGGFKAGSQRSVTHNGTTYTVYENQLLNLGYVVPKGVNALPASQNERMSEAMTGGTETKIDLITMSAHSSTLIMVQDLGADFVDYDDEAFVELLFENEEFVGTVGLSIAQMLEAGGFSDTQTAVDSQVFLSGDVPCITCSCQKDGTRYFYTCVIQKRYRFLLLIIAGNENEDAVKEDFTHFYTLEDGPEAVLETL